MTTPFHVRSPLNTLLLAVTLLGVAGRAGAQHEGAPAAAASLVAPAALRADIEELRAALMADPAVFAQNVTERLIMYALGRVIEAHDMPYVRAIVRDAGKNGNRMSSFITGVVNSSAFRMARPSAVETTTASQQGH